MWGSLFFYLLFVLAYFPEFRLLLLLFFCKFNIPWYTSFFWDTPFFLWGGCFLWGGFCCSFGFLCCHFFCRFCCFCCCFKIFSYFCSQFEVAPYREGVVKSISTIILLISSLLRPSFDGLIFFVTSKCELLSNANKLRTIWWIGKVVVMLQADKGKWGGRKIPKHSLACK